MATLRIRPQYITDSQGQKTAVVLEMKQFEKLLAKLEEAEDVLYARSVREEPSENYAQYRRVKGSTPQE